MTRGPNCSPRLRIRQSIPVLATGATELETAEVTLRSAEAQLKAAEVVSQIRLEPIVTHNVVTYATVIDAPNPRAEETTGRVWFMEGRRLSGVNIRLGVTDGSASELLGVVGRPTGASTSGNSRALCSSAVRMRRSTSRTESTYSDTLARSPDPRIRSRRFNSEETASIVVRSRSSRASLAAGSVLPLLPNRRSKTARGSRSTGNGVAGVRHATVFV